MFPIPFRYDVILHIGQEKDSFEQSLWVDWRDQRPSLITIRQMLTTNQPDVLGIAGVPNARLSTEAWLREFLNRPDCPLTVSDVYQALREAQNTIIGIDPEDLWALGDELHYTVTINWSGNGADGHLNVLFQRNSPYLLSTSILPFTTSQISKSHQPWSAYTNNPLRSNMISHLPRILRETLVEQLPEYMVPQTFLFLETIPLMANGKVDRGALPKPDRGWLEQLEGYDAPRTPAEQVLATIWADVLDLERVGIHNNFFVLGGDSIRCMLVVVKANATGMHLTPRLLFRHQTIAELAATNEAIAISFVDHSPRDIIPLTPIQKLFFVQRLPKRHRWAQALLLETARALDPHLIDQALQHVFMHHDALHLQLVRQGSISNKTNTSESPLWQLGDIRAIQVVLVDHETLTKAEQEASITMSALQLGACLDGEAKPLFTAAIFTSGSALSSYLLLVIHQLVVDHTSWRILLEDIETAYQQLEQGKAIVLPKTISFEDWSRKLSLDAQSKERQHELTYWLAEQRTHIAPLPKDNPDNNHTEEMPGTVIAVLGKGETQVLLHEIPSISHTQPTDLLLTALTQVLAEWIGSDKLLLDIVESYRDILFPNMNLSRTVGWLDMCFPKKSTRLPVATRNRLMARSMRRIPHGISLTGE